MKLGQNSNRGELLDNYHSIAMRSRRLAEVLAGSFRQAQRRSDVQRELKFRKAGLSVPRGGGRGVALNFDGAFSWPLFNLEISFITFECQS